MTIKKIYRNFQFFLDKFEKKISINSIARVLKNIFFRQEYFFATNKNDEKSKMLKVAWIKNVLFRWEYLLAANKNISCELVFVWNITKIN
jgi:hypothetical protein